MRLLRIKDIGKVVSGSTPKTGNKEFWNGDIHWVTPKEISKLKSQYLNETERKITDIGLKSCSASILPKGSILFTSRAPIGLVAISNIDVCTNQGFKSIVLKDGFYPLYIYYILKSKVRELNNLGTGTTFKELSKTTFEKYEIPVPDLSEQIRIADTLSKTESIIKQRKESIDLLDEFLKSTFLDMFGDPLQNDKKWKQDKVENYTDCIVPGRDKPKSFTGEIPWFTTDDLIDKGFVLKSKKDLGLSEFEINEVRAKRIPIGSVIMTCVGDLGIVSINKEVCIVNQQLHAFQCKPMLNNVFLMFNLSFMKSYMYKMASTTTVPYMNKTICNSIPIFLPPISLQNQFSLIVEKTEHLKSQFKESLYELENLFGCLSQRAFKGVLDLDKMEIDSTVLNEFKIVEKKIIPELNPAMLKVIEQSQKLQKLYEQQTKIAEQTTRFFKPIQQMEKLLAPIKNLPVIPDAVLQAQKNYEKILASLPKNIQKKEGTKIGWEDVSSQYAADLIKEKYTGFHFTTEMLFRFFNEEHLIYPNYFSSEELKTNPQLHSADDLKSILFSALDNGNPFLKLEQVFYNGEKENFTLNITPEDYELIKERSKEERSGVYFTIVS